MAVSSESVGSISATLFKHIGHLPPSTSAEIGVPQVWQVVESAFMRSKAEQVFHLQSCLGGIEHGHLDLLPHTRTETPPHPMHGDGKSL